MAGVKQYILQTFSGPAECSLIFMSCGLGWGVDGLFVAAAMNTYYLVAISMFEYGCRGWSALSLYCHLPYDRVTILRSLMRCCA